MRVRAVVSGCGALSPFGRGVDAFWGGLLSGRSALAPIRTFDTTGMNNAVAGEVHGFEGDQHSRHDRITQFALVSVREALTAARLDLATLEPTSIGVIFATTLGGMWSFESFVANQLRGEQSSRRSLFEIPYTALATSVARELGIRGPVSSPSIACASGTQAVGLALEWVRNGFVDVCIAGGAETLCPFIVTGFNCLRATTSDTVRPFDARRSGLLLGEGSAALAIESLEHARARGFQPNVEVAGAGLSSDAVHMTAPARDGAGAMRAMNAALNDAGMTSAEIDFVSAHGTGTVFNDAMEIAALRSVLAKRADAVPINGIKGAIGHTLGVAGVFEAILCALALEEGVLPPTAGCEVLDSDNPLDIVRGEPRRRDFDVALSTSSAFAGNNAAIVLRRFSSTDSPGAIRPPAARTNRMAEDESPVITGIGLISSLGNSAAELSRRFASGESGVVTDGALVVTDLPSDVIPAEKRTRFGRMDRLCQFLLTSAFLAVNDAKLTMAEVDRSRFGLSVGTGLGCVLTNEEYYRRVLERGIVAASPQLFAYTVSSAAAGEISIAFGIHGPNATSHQGFAAGLGAVGWAADQIRQGRADVMLAGGGDVVGPALVNALRSTNLLKPLTAGCPFIDSTPGICPAEAAVVFVLESPTHAERRGARILGRISGSANGFEPTLVHADRSGRGIEETIRLALRAGGIDCAAVRRVFTSAHGTPLDDVEAVSLDGVFGKGQTRISPKVALGEAFAASGLLSLALAAGNAGNSLHEVNLINAVCYSGSVVSLLFESN